MDKDVLGQGVFFALQQPKHIANPYPLYQRLRTEAPVYWDFVWCAWVLTRYSDVRAALTDSRLTTENFPFNVSQLPPDIQNDLAPLGRVMKSSVLYNDAPVHDRLRRPLHRAFNPNAFERLRVEIEALAGKLLAKAERRGSMDFVSDYCEPLADYMLGELLGSPRLDRTEVIESCATLRKFLTARRMGHETVLGAKAAVKALDALRTYLRTIIAGRQGCFADSIIARSLAVESSEASPTEDEILSNCVLSLDAGLRNMSASIANALIALLRHPEEFARLRDDPDSMTLATEELLRYDSPVQVAVRGVPEEIEFAGRRIGPNQQLILLLGAANRDQEQFADPNRLDLTRRPNHHVSFGIGSHGCVGGWMTRFGLEIAIGAIIRRQTHLRLMPRKLRWCFPLIRHTVQALPVWVNRRRALSKEPPLATARALWPKPTAQTTIPSPL